MRPLPACEPASDARAISFATVRRRWGLHRLGRASKKANGGIVKGCLRILPMNSTEDYPWLVERSYDQDSAVVQGMGSPIDSERGTYLTPMPEACVFDDGNGKKQTLFEKLTTKPAPKAIVRVYVTQARQLHAMDRGNTSDPFVTVALGKETKGDSKSEREIHKTVKTSDVPYFGQVFEFETTLPGAPQLTIKLKDWDAIGKNELIGQTSIDLEDRFFCHEWHQLGSEDQPELEPEPEGGEAKGRETGSAVVVSQRKVPTEVRSLCLPGSREYRGEVELWVDIFTKDQSELYPKIDIRRPADGTYELRVIVWEAEDMVAKDRGGMNDLIVSGHLTMNSQKDQKRETDTHWRAKDGKGSFNYRYIYDIELRELMLAVAPRRAA
eukprot:SAG11_NODE_1605_length_4593_cov_2.083667_5_plen_382_part_00